MRIILITNDDGIMAEGLVRLARTAKHFGEVWVVAPESQRSGASHAFTLHEHIDLIPHPFPVEEVRAFACSGTPVDCVRTGSLHLLPRKPDVVLSGINFGYNAATDIQYSGTVGAAMEGAFQGSRAIAVSEEAVGCHEVTDHYLEEVLGQWIDVRLGRGEVLNVNFPGCPLSLCRGIRTERTASDSSFFDDHYKVIRELPGGGVRLMVEGKPVQEAEEGTDKRALMDNYVSVGVIRNLC